MSVRTLTVIGALLVVGGLVASVGPFELSAEPGSGWVTDPGEIAALEARVSPFGYTRAGVRYQLTWWQLAGYGISALGIVALVAAVGQAIGLRWRGTGSTEP
jgi:hypothetical protein